MNQTLHHLGPEALPVHGSNEKENMTEALMYGGRGAGLIKRFPVLLDREMVICSQN